MGQAQRVLAEVGGSPPEAVGADRPAGSAAPVVLLGLASLALLASPLLWHGPLSVYGLLVGSWLVLQTGLAELECRRQAARPRRPSDAAVTVVVPSYNEEPTALRECVASLLRQDYAGPLEVIVVDDGSRSPVPDLSDLDRPHGRRLVVHRFAANQGKRSAQAWGIRAGAGEYLVTVDSDAVLERDAIDRAIDAFDPEVGAVTGVAYVSNRVNLLTRLLQLRYWAAFHQERASQSYCGVMLCCAGVFSVYRRALVEGLLERYVGQRFLGRPCHYGDDRHLTNLLLEQGHTTRVALDAVVWTITPHTLRAWLKQQQRWSKSYYRELLWSLRFAHRRHAYLLYCLVFQAVLPLLFLVGLARAAGYLSVGDPLQGLRYLAAVALMAWLRGLYGLWRTGDAQFLWMPVYGFLHLAAVFPVRLAAFVTLWDNRWGTR